MAVSAQRRRRVLVAVVAALIAAGAFVLALTYTSKPGTSGANTPGTQAPPASVSVAVASKNIPQGRPLASANVALGSVPQAYLSQLTKAGGSDFTSVASLTGSTPYYASTTIIAGTPILSSMVTTSAAAAATPVPGIPSELPSGYVAVSLPYSPGAASGTGEGTGGYIQVLDRVDIVAYDNGKLYWAYDNVLVLAVGQSSGVPAAGASAAPSSSSSGSSTASGLIMVELPSQDAAVLIQIVDTPNSLVQYLIRSSKDYPSPGSSPVPAVSTPSAA